MHATIATIFGFPRATSRSKNTLNTGFQRMQLMATMNNALLTALRPSQMNRRPWRFPLS